MGLEVMAACVAFLSASLVLIVWRVVSQTPLQREQDHAMLLGVLERYRAESAVEVAHADAIRESSRVAQEQVDAIEVLLSEELSEQQRQGFAGDVAMARAAMVQVGLDPEDDDDVEAWNSRLGLN